MKKINEVVEKIKTNRKIQIVLIVFLFLVIALLILNMFLPSPKSNEVANIAPPPNLVKKVKVKKKINKKHKKHIVVKKENGNEKKENKVEKENIEKVENKKVINEKLNLDKKKVYVYKGELLVDGKINDRVIVDGDIYKKGDILFGKEIEKIEGNYVYFDDGTKYFIIIR